MFFSMARLFIGGLFLYAGVPKIMDPTAFAHAVYRYQILPDFLVNLTAIVLPWLEVITGGFLVAGIWMAGAALTANLMLYIFAAALVATLVRGLNIDCGCFVNTREEIINAGTIARDIAFLVVAGYLFAASLTRRTDS
ncbi:MAG: DoxX family protein [Deltaproteobacteria bacterium]|nr:DoxX family protein [Deltaproteobacteria bacterium]